MLNWTELNWTEWNWTEREKDWTQREENTLFFFVPWSEGSLWPDSLSGQRWFHVFTHKRWSVMHSSKELQLTASCCSSLNGVSRFRHVALIALRQHLIKWENQKSTRFLWWSNRDVNQDIVEYRMNVHVLDQRHHCVVQTYRRLLKTTGLTFHQR